MIQETQLSFKPSEGQSIKEFHHFLHFYETSSGFAPDHTIKSNIFWDSITLPSLQRLCIIARKTGASGRMPRSKSLENSTSAFSHLPQVENHELGW
jgi:hypothetical protein